VPTNLFGLRCALVAAIAVAAAFVTERLDELAPLAHVDDAARRFVCQSSTGAAHLAVGYCYDPAALLADDTSTF